MLRKPLSVHRTLLSLCLTLLGGSIATLPSTTFAQTAPASPPVLTWDAKKQEQFVMALASDAQGQVWVGTEDQGLWRYNPRAPQPQQWTQFTTKDGLGDNSIYALAVDKLGRVWQNYGQQMQFQVK